VRRVVLWRHGQTASNLEGRWQGQLDVALDETGVAQAQVAAAVLAAEHPPVRVVSSDLRRAAATADVLGSVAGVDVALDPGLREMAAGAWEGRLRRDIKAQDGERLAAWRRGDPVRAGATGELRTEIATRVAAAVDRHACEDGTAVLVGHGGALRAGVLHLVGLPPDARLASLANCHWGVLEEERDGAWRLLQWNVGPQGAREGAEA